MITITDILTSLSSHPYHVSSSLIDNTEHILSETQDNNVDIIKVAFNKEGDHREIILVVNKDFISNLPVGANYGDIVFNELAYYENFDLAMYEYKSNFGNLGKPPTYYINEHGHEHQAIRIKTDPNHRTDNQEVELYTLESLLENIRNQPDHISSDVSDVSEFFKRETGDDDTVAINIKFKRNDDERDVRIILNNQYILNLPKSLDFGDQIANGMVYCKYCDNCDQGGYGGYLTENENLGSPPTYYVSKISGRGKRIKSFETNPIKMDIKLTELFSIIKQLKDVEKVELEFARYDSIKQTVGSDDAVVLTIWKYKALAPILTYYSLNTLGTIENYKIIQELEKNGLTN